MVCPSSEDPLVVLREESSMTSSSRRKRSKKEDYSPSQDKENKKSQDGELLRDKKGDSKQKKKKDKKRKTSEGDKKEKKKRKKAKPTSKERSSSKSESSRSKTKLTREAIRKLVTFSQSLGKEKPDLPDEIVIRIHLQPGQGHSSAKHDHTLLATMDDGVHRFPVILLNDLSNERLQRYLMASSEDESTQAFYVSVKGLIATHGQNPKYELEPILCLTKVEALSKKLDTPVSGIPFFSSTTSISTNEVETPASPPPVPQQAPGATSGARVRTGYVGSFLDQNLPFLTTDEFARCHDTNTQRLLLTDHLSDTSGENSASANTAIHALNKHAELAQTFLTRHHAMMTLPTSESSTEHTVESYNRALQEFAGSQLDRQKASLAGNAGREAAERADQITRQYSNILETVLASATSNDTASSSNTLLTPAKLCEWHAGLLQDLHPDAGRFRQKSARAGNTVFCRPKDIANELDKFCASLNNLQERFQLGDLSKSGPSSTTVSPANIWNAVVFAAVAMYGIIDIHPFADGNGRMSRIVANWALRSLPFTTNLFATPAQRAEYVFALETTRHLLSLADRKKIYGLVTPDDVLQVTKSVGIFAPIVRLLMDRVGRAVVEFNRVWQEKLGLATEALQCTAVRKAREQAREGSCIICLDDDPNIATLCCGKAVHLNCIAEWLSGKNSCPCCRSDMPTISGRVVRAARKSNRMRQEEEEESGRSNGGFSPSNRRMQRRFVRNAEDVILRLLMNSNGDANTTETDEDDADIAFETTTVHEDIGVENSDDLVDDDEHSDSSSSFSSSGDSDESEDSSFDENSDENSSASNGLVYESTSSSMGSSGSESRPDTGSGDVVDENSSIASQQHDESVPQGSFPHVHQFCNSIFCRNRPAIDCTNNLCGRCCVLGGEFHCPRHNS